METVKHFPLRVKFHAMNLMAQLYHTTFCPFSLVTYACVNLTRSGIQCCIRHWFKGGRFNQMATLALEKARHPFAAEHFERLGWAVFIAVAVFASIYLIYLSNPL